MRLFAWWKRRQWETRMDEEFRFHLESQIGDYVRDGLSPSDAERRAQQEFGALELARDECRDVMPLAWLDSARRSLRKETRRVDDRRDGGRVGGLARGGPVGWPRCGGNAARIESALTQIDDIRGREAA